MQHRPRSDLVSAKVCIALEDLMKVIAYAKCLPVEINGFMLVDVHEGYLWLRDPFITPQTVTDVTAEADVIGLAQCEANLRKSGVDPTKLRCQWHSHVDSVAYFSPIDMESIAGFTGDWLVSLVVNHAGEYACRFDYLRPVRFGTVVPLDVMVDHHLTQAMVDDCLADICTNVSMKTGDALVVDDDPRSNGPFVTLRPPSSLGR